MVRTVVKADRHPLGPAGRTRTTRNKSKAKLKTYFTQPLKFSISTYGSLGWKPSVVQAILNLETLTPALRAAPRNAKENQRVLALPAEKIPEPGERLLPDGTVERLEW